MKELDELHLPDDIRYTDEHEWARITGDIARIGVSDYAQDQLGDIVFVELPAVGDTIARGEVFGTLESVKAVSELYLPLSGEVVAVNTALTDAPELINQDPYAAWIIEVRPTDAGEYDQLLTAAAYLDLLRG
ncbi:glycine cleavage system protein GcvH [uncultured Desulfobulbus sp.]|uniref:glycine cleavage system protein GcvH n=1 Tax=uncultured Desulfobulbus sp. TaxID=239745 RepID=UPI0026140833|nr:glycine cleavage system protein GcvH [uncultured Desulfobulbus sp.]